MRAYKLCSLLGAFALFLMASLTGCQEPLPAVPDKKVVVPADAASARLQDVVLYHLRGASWLLYSRKALTYDAAGRAATELTHRREEQAWVLTGRTTFRYNEAGHRIETFSEHCRSDGWVNEGRTVMHYDTLGRVTTTVGEGWHLADGRWVPASRTSHTYDEQGRLLTTLEQRPYYGVDGEQEHIGLDSMAQGAWFNNSLAVYHYEAGKEPTAREGLVWKDGEWEQAGRYLYRYDKAGRMIESLLEQPAQGGWEADLRSTFMYDAADRLAETQTQRWEDDAWVTASRARYRYE